VGTLAVQFAKLRDARVLATGAGRDGALLVRRLGADMAIDGRHDDVAAAAREFAPDGLHAILAFVGQGLQQAIETLQPDGRLAYPNGVEPVPRRRRGIKVVPYDAVPGVREFQKLNRAIEAARLAVPLAGVFPLDQAAQAHRRLEQGHVLGKIVLRIRA
jgi:NADPH:quinone reductase-like Zn-dependent oxidoreductase